MRENTFAPLTRSECGKVNFVVLYEDLDCFRWGAGKK